MAAPLTWKLILLLFLKKMRKPQCLADCRGISLTSVIAKWYMTGLMILVRAEVERVDNALWRWLMIFDFEANHMCGQICSFLSILLNRGLEWGRQAPEYVGSVGVKSAFDFYALPS